MAEGALTLADFQPHVGSRFWLQRDGEPPIATALVEVRAATAGSTRPRPPFSLAFDAPAEPQLAQRIYRLTHAELGALDIFLVPVARSATGMTYEAVFG